MAALSKTQIDQLGDRLRRGSFSEADLRVLDDYRRSFDPAIKYGGGAARDRDLLIGVSNVVAILEEVEMRVVGEIASLPAGTGEQPEARLVTAQAKLDEAKQLLRDAFRELIASIEEELAGEDP